MRQNVTLCFLGFVTYYFSKKKNCCVCFVCLILFIRILFLLFCCFLLFFEIYSIFLSFLLLKLIFTSGIIIIIKNVTYWYNYCFSKAVVIGDNHNHNHNHKCYNVYLFIYLFIHSENSLQIWACRNCTTPSIRPLFPNVIFSRSCHDWFSMLK